MLEVILIHVVSSRPARLYSETMAQKVKVRSAGKIPWLKHIFISEDLGLVPSSSIVAQNRL